MIQTVLKLKNLLNPREQRQAMLLLLLMLVLGLVEMVGVASIFPLIAVLSDPSIIQNNQYLRLAYESLGFRDNNSFFIFLSVAVFAVIVIRTGLTVVTSYGTLRFAQMRSHALSVRLLGSYLKRPYVFFLNRHSADMGKSVLSEVGQVIAGSLMPVLQLASRGLTALFLVALVVAVNPLIAVGALVIMTFLYGIIYVAIRRYVRRMGHEQRLANRGRYQVAQEVLAGVKEVKISGLEHGYLQRFDKNSLRFAGIRIRHHLVRDVPRHVLELITLGGILTIILVLLFKADGQLNTALPIIALYAFAGLRLLPAIQTIYQSIAVIRFNGPALDALYTDLMEAEHTTDLKATDPLPLTREIALERAHFAYPEAGRPALSNISLTIPVRSTVGFVGATGAGKSTIVDLILGLLEPQQGVLKVDGTVITRKNVRAWQRSVGYVPQQIFLADESVSANIALGVSPEMINMAAVERAARMANLHDFIMCDLPSGYDTEVGDRGMRLSGGQRQRVGIARALYHDPDVLVLDEATSALDVVTEKSVIDAIKNLSQQKTIILIAHRLGTVKHCDTIFKIDNGEITAFGQFGQVVGSEDRLIGGA